MVKSGVLERLAIPAPHMTPALKDLKEINIISHTNKHEFTQE
jgi:hypothetical protein